MQFVIYTPRPPPVVFMYRVLFALPRGNFVFIPGTNANMEYSRFVESLFVPEVDSLKLRYAFLGLGFP